MKDIVSLFNPYKRTQNVKLSLLTSSINGCCACGCGVKLKGKQVKWASKNCCDSFYRKYEVYRGNTNIIRQELYSIDRGYCRNCGVLDPNWQADHIIPVHKGGGACGLENFQTLCLDCHKEKTKKDLHNPK